MRFAAHVAIVLALLSTCASVSPAADKRIVIDSALRRAEVPARVDRVYAAGAPATVFLYTLAPDKMLGWNRALVAYERAFIPARYADLPTLGRLTGRGNTANAETVLGTKPDVIVDYGSLGTIYVSLANRMQEQTGIPYLLIDGSLAAIPNAYVLAGTLLDLPDRGRELARYAERLLVETDRRVATVPAEKR